MHVIGRLSPPKRVIRQNTDALGVASTAICKLFADSAFMVPRSMLRIFFPKFPAYRAMKWRTKAGMSSFRLRRGMSIGNTLSREKRSSLKVPAATAACKSQFGAATTTKMCWLPPTRSMTRSCETRKSLVRLRLALQLLQQYQREVVG
jgi:hypothetical protein